jgi:hypothetical protein
MNPKELQRNTRIFVRITLHASALQLEIRNVMASSQNWNSIARPNRIIEKGTCFRY